ncbi:MAG: PAS domain S-box protein, partial [Chloroflexi bacterium]|nr:PAS domain S-box protein [Chloroflexota bacterium]
MNQATQTMFGITEKELLGQQLTKIIPKRYQNTHHKALERLRAGTPARLVGHIRELHGLHKEGHEFPIELSLSTWQSQGTTYYTTIIRDITERKQAEDLLRASENRYRMLVESSPYCIHEIDIEGCLMSMNPSGLKMMGVQDESEIRGLPYLDSVADDDKARISNLLELALQGEASEFEFNASNGLIFQSSFVPIKDKNGDVTLLTGLTLDITERVRTDKSLQKSEKHAVALLEAIPDLMFRINNKDVFLDYHAATSDLYTPPDVVLIGKKTRDLVPPEFADLINQQVELTLKSGEMQTFEYQLPIPERGWVDFEARMVKSGKDEVTSIVRDITERKRAEEELRQYEYIVSSSTDMMALLDKNFVYLAANNVYQEAYKLTPDELIGLTATELFGKAFFETAILPNAQRCLSGEHVNYKDWFELPGYEPRYMDINYYPYLGRDNEVKGFVVNGRNITDQAQAEEQIKYQASLLQNVTDAIISTNMDWIVTSWNQAAEIMYGFKAEEAIGKPMGDIVKPKYQQTKRDDLINSFLKDMRWEGEVIHHHKGGFPIDIWGSVSMLRDANGNQIGAVAVNRDITERKQAEDALHALATTFTAISGEEFFVRISRHLTTTLGIDYAFVGEFVKNDSKIRVVGGFGKGEKLPTFDYALAGTPCENVIGQSLCFYPYDVQNLFPKDHMLVEMSIEGYLGSPIFSKSGQPLGIMVLLDSKPITNQKVMKSMLKIFVARASAEIERMQAEESLRQLKQAIEQSSVSVVITDTKGAIQYVNPKFSEVTGYSAAEAMGQNPSLLKSGKHMTEFYREMWKTIKAGHEWRGEFHNRKKNGDFYWELTSIAGVKDRNGKITHYVAVKEDITQRKQREEEQVRQERLAAVGQLAAGIAHDFNNVMAVITLYSELLQRSPNLSEKELKQVHTIFEQANHAADLTRQILDFSRRSVREPRPFDLKIFLNETVQFIERTIPERVQVQFTSSRGNYTVNADPTQLQQMMTNLTVNARDAIPRGGTLSINLSRMTLTANQTLPSPDMESGEWVKLAISDTGIGIAPEALTHIYEPFFTTKGVGKGSGLGLAQVYGIVKQHAGHIIAESQLGEGTTFTIYLPVWEGGTAVPPSHTPTSIPMGQGETILLVEDNQTLLEATRTILESLNYKAITTQDGSAALNTYQAQSDQISLILADVVMPKMDGFELVKMLQQHSPPPKVLLMSGFPRDIEMPPEMKRIVSGWLQKPIDLHQLAQTLHDILRS